MKDLLFMKVAHGSCYLFRDFENSFLVKYDLLLVQQIKETASRHKLCYHIVLLVLIKGNPHIQYYIRVPQAVNHLDLLNEVLNSFMVDIFLSEFLDSHLDA